jgi:hypothetical protein
MKSIGVDRQKTEHARADLSLAGAAGLPLPPAF